MSHDVASSEDGDFEFSQAREFRVALAKVVAKLVGIVAAVRGLRGDDVRLIHTDLINKVVPRISPFPIPDLYTAPVQERLELMAEKLVDRVLRARAKGHGRRFLDDEDCRRILRKEPVALRDIDFSKIIFLWNSLTQLERLVLDMEDLKLDKPIIASVLQVSVDEATRISREAHEKIHRTYWGLD